MGSPNGRAVDFILKGSTQENFRTLINPDALIKLASLYETLLTEALMEPELKRLLTREAIRDLRLRYCHYLDTNRMDALAGCNLSGRPWHLAGPLGNP